MKPALQMWLFGIMQFDGSIEDSVVKSFNLKLGTEPQPKTEFQPKEKTFKII